MSFIQRKIFLLGFMGCGKSTIGEALSETLKVKSIDLDEIIEIKQQSSIGDLFSNRGEDAFRNMESEALKDVLAIDSLVIALGGGTPCFNENMKVINSEGISFYIELPPEKLAARLFSEKEHRPLIKDQKDISELTDYISKKLEQRAKFYSLAHHIINGDASVKEIVSEITSRLDSL